MIILIYHIILYNDNSVKYDIHFTSSHGLQIHYIYFTENPTLYKKFVRDNFRVLL